MFRVFMFRLVCSLLLLVPTFAKAQTNLSLATSFRTHDVSKYNTVIMENETIPLPGKGDSTYSITITVTDIHNKDGVIRFKFYDDATPFPHDKGFLRIVVPKTEVVNGTFTATYYGFTSKNMGIALQDDENNNWILDMGWFFPKEGHAFSDYYHDSLRRPVYSDFSFLLTAHRQVTMKMKYY